MELKQKEDFLNEVCNLAAQFLSANNAANLTAVISNIESIKKEIIKDLKDGSRPSKQKDV